MTDERHWPSPRGGLGDFELQASQRLVRVEQQLDSLAELVRDRSGSTHSAIDRLGAKLEAHMDAEEAERLGWSQKLAAIIERVTSLPAWRDDVEKQLRTLQDWRAYLTGAMAVVVVLLLPLVFKWVERTFFG